jgi:hypothetical protein
MSLAARLLNVFASPGEVFEDVKASAPSVGNWLAPALLLILVGWVGGWLVLSQDSIKHQISEITDKAIEKEIQKRKMSPQQAEQARRVGEQYGSIGTKVSIVAAPVFAAFIVPFWWGLIVWLFGAKVFKGSFTYMKAVEVAGLANTIAVLDAIVRTLLIMTLGNLFAAPSLALLLKEFDPQDPMHSLLGVFNVMTFWILAVRSIGLARLSGASFGKSMAAVFGLWAAWTALMVGFGFAMRAISGG